MSTDGQFFAHASGSSGQREKSTLKSCPNGRGTCTRPLRLGRRHEPLPWLEWIRLHGRCERMQAKHWRNWSGCQHYPDPYGTLAQRSDKCFFFPFWSTQESVDRCSVDNNVSWSTVLCPLETCKTQRHCTGLQHIASLCCCMEHLSQVISSPFRLAFAGHRLGWKLLLFGFLHPQENWLAANWWGCSCGGQRAGLLFQFFSHVFLIFLPRSKRRVKHMKKCHRNHPGVNSEGWEEPRFRMLNCWVCWVLGKSGSLGNQMPIVCQKEINSDLEQAKTTSEAAAGS